MFLNNNQFLTVFAPKKASFSLKTFLQKWTSHILFPILKPKTPIWKQKYYSLLISRWVPRAQGDTTKFSGNFFEKKKYVKKIVLLWSKISSGFRLEIFFFVHMTKPQNRDFTWFPKISKNGGRIKFMRFFLHWGIESLRPLGSRFFSKGQKKQ